jgi:hypothetical protein
MEAHRVTRKTAPPADSNVFLIQGSKRDSPDCFTYWLTLRSEHGKRRGEVTWRARNLGKG